MSTNAPSTSRATADAPPLSDEQWRGLARLADLVNGVDAGLQGPLGGPVSELLVAVGRAGAEHDLAALFGELLELLQAAHESGGLRKLRDNLALINETMQLLAPMAGELVQRLKAMPLEELSDELAGLQALYRKIDAARRFVDEHLADELTTQLVKAGEFWQQHELDGALGDLLKTIGRLHQTGALAQLRRLADYLGDNSRDLDGLALLGDGIRNLDRLQVGRMGHLVEGFERALDDAEREEPRLGGTTGLLHLLRDKQVQKGLRALFILPVYLERSQRH